MVRKALKQNLKENPDPIFKFRGVDNTRVEALSDGVFAIAMALLIISTSIPETYSELMLFLKDLVPFALCMALLILIWHQHYTFFIRYGFKDAKIVAINTFLLFLILFYIYPLKFLMQLLFDMFRALLFNDNKLFNYLFTETIQISETPNLMIIYGIGAASIFYTLAIMYKIAYRRRNALGLSTLEEFQTKASLQVNVLMGSIPLFSCLVCWLVKDPMLAFSLGGMSYMLYPVIMISFGRLNNKKLNNLISTEK